MSKYENAHVDKQDETIGDSLYQIAFQLISVAGDSRSSALMAIQKAKKFKFAEAENLLRAANDEFIKSHDIQSKLLTNEAQGSKSELNVILVHSLDHLTMATMALEEAKEMIELYKMIDVLKKQIHN